MNVKELRDMLNDISDDLDDIPVRLCVSELSFYIEDFYAVNKAEIRDGEVGDVSCYLCVEGE